MKNPLRTAALASMLGMGAILVSASSASASIVCNDDGDCWHVRDQYSYPTGVHLVVHEDSWRWDDNDRDHHYRWHEHDGRGYWNGGVWVAF